MSKARSKEHIKVQKAGKERDRYVCQICGVDKDVQGHHVFDVQYNGAPNVDNIVTLCSEHHKDVHKGSIDITLF